MKWVPAQVGFGPTNAGVKDPYLKPLGDCAIKMIGGSLGSSSTAL